MVVGDAPLHGGDETAPRAVELIRALEARAVREDPVAPEPAVVEIHAVGHDLAPEVEPAR